MLSLILGIISLILCLASRLGTEWLIFPSLAFSLTASITGILSLKKNKNNTKSQIGRFLGAIVSVACILLVLVLIIDKITAI